MLGMLRGQQNGGPEQYQLPAFLFINRIPQKLLRSLGTPKNNYFSTKALEGHFHVKFRVKFLLKFRVKFQVKFHMKWNFTWIFKWIFAWNSTWKFKWIFTCHLTIRFFLFFFLSEWHAACTTLLDCSLNYQFATCTLIIHVIIFFPLQKNLEVTPARHSGIFNVSFFKGQCLCQHLWLLHWTSRYLAPITSLIPNHRNVSTDTHMLKCKASFKVTRHLCFKNSKNLRPQDILALYSANKPSFTIFTLRPRPPPRPPPGECWTRQYLC